MDDGKFSRYEIREVVGSGGMATVYLAYDPETGREVALKILKRELLQNTQVRERFEREIKIIAMLEHEAIVPVYDAGRNDGELFFVMRLMTGGSLFERMPNEPMPHTQIIRIIQRIAPALDYAHNHEQRIIHRDLKPGNILFDKSNNAFISDFGIAKLIDAPNTLTGEVVGTPRYMSPEQARGKDLDKRSDIYSLGLILLEMLIGKTCFKDITEIGLAFRPESEPLPRLLDINPNLPAGIQTVIEKALSSDPNLRYSSAMEFVDALTAALSEPPQPVDPPQSVELQEPVHPPQPPFFSRIRLTLGVIVLALLILSVWGYRKFVLPPITPTEPAAVTITPSATTSPPVEPAATIETVVTDNAGGADKIALTANNEIHIMDIDGSNLEALTQTDIPKFDLQWLPSGEELLYVEGNCVYTIHVEPTPKQPEQRACFDDPKFQGFRVSPDGERVAISIANRLLVLPLDFQVLAAVSSAFELQKLESLCLDYATVTVKGALWSSNGQMLAIRYQGIVYGRIGDTIRVIQGNWERCKGGAILELDEFPADHFVPEGYARYPLLPSYQWDGDQRFLLNSFIRNDNYGELYLYDMSTEIARHINPIDHVCCYGSAAFSPDGTYILLVFQDVRGGSNSENKLYYIPIDQLDTVTVFTPLPLPRLFFQNPDENIQLALRPSVQHAP